MNERDKRLYLVIGILLMLTFGYTLINFAFGGEIADDYWLIPNIDNDYEYRWVNIYYVDEAFVCNTEDASAAGCWRSIDNSITILKSEEYAWAPQGCTTRDHEIYHAMGYEHGEGPLSTTCPNDLVKQDDSMNIIYDEDNIHHWNPVYIHVPVEFDPRYVSWYVGDK